MLALWGRVGSVDDVLPTHGHRFYAIALRRICILTTFVRAWEYCTMHVVRAVSVLHNSVA